MPRKNKSGNWSSKKNTAPMSREPSSAEKLSQNHRYEGYDEDRPDLNPARQNDYHVDENDIDQHSGEYRDLGGNS